MNLRKAISFIFIVILTFVFAYSCSHGIKTEYDADKVEENRLKMKNETPSFNLESHSNNQMVYLEIKQAQKDVYKLMGSNSNTDLYTLMIKEQYQIIKEKHSLSEEEFQAIIQEGILKKW